MRISIAFVLTALAASSAQAQLLYAFPRGDTLTYAGSFRMQMTMSSTAPVGPQEVTLGFNGRMRVHRFAEDSLLVWFDSVNVEPGPMLPADQLATMIRSQQMRLNWDARGGERKPAGAAPGDVSGMINTLSAVFPRLPVGGVSLGTSWADTVTSDISVLPGVKQNTSGITNLRAARDTVVDGQPGLVIEFKGTADTKIEGVQNGMQMSATNKMEMTGSLVLLRNGSVTGSRSNLVMTGNSSFSGAMSMSADTRALIDTSMQLVRKR